MPKISTMIVRVCQILIVFALVVCCGKLEEDADYRPLDVPDLEPVEYYPTGTATPSLSAPSVAGYVNESLQNGQTVGQFKDGTFTAQGLQFRGITWYLRYHIPTTPRGFIEFTASGFRNNEYHPTAQYQEHGEFKAYLLTMWDGAAGYDHDTAAFIYEIRKYGLISGRADASNSMVFTITSNRVFTENFYFRLNWDPRKAYRFRIEWGRGQTRLFRDGTIVGSCSYRAEFTPSTHLVQIGANLENPQPHRRKEAPEGLLISDVVIGAL